MKKTTWILRIGTAAAIALAFSAAACCAEPDRAEYESAITWRSDGTGDYAFNDAGGGAVEADAFGASYEALPAIEASGKITSVSASWSFTGKVTLEVSATGKSADYAAIVNGVPLALPDFKTGSLIRWRATLGADSSLTEVRISYTDDAGARGDFGNPALTGFASRRAVYIKGSAETLFNYQIPVCIGESSKAPGCDINLKDLSLKSDFNDIYFTCADGQTPVPYYRENMLGAAPDRAAAFWIKVPEIPKDGVMVYIYYGKASAPDFSDGKAVFDMFEEFDVSIDPKVWTAKVSETGRAEISFSSLIIRDASLASAAYKFTDGIIEYSAEAEPGGVAALTIGDPAADGITVYSSALAGLEHCVARGGNVDVNTVSPVLPGAFYAYRVTASGPDMTFQRFSEDWSGLQAEAEYDRGAFTSEFPIGFSATGNEGGQYRWVRTRQFASQPAAVDTEKTAASAQEATNLPVFYKTTIAPDGDITLAENEIKGTYTSALIKAPYQARIITPYMLSAGPEPVLSYVSTKEGGSYYPVTSGKTVYASKKDFVMGNELRYKAELNGPADKDAEGLSLASFALAYYPGTITVTMPYAGQPLEKGEACNIYWEAPGYEADYRMDIAYSLDGGQTFADVAAGVKNSLSYAWQAPYIDTARALVKVIDSKDPSVFGVSADYFTIGDAAMLSQAEREESEEAASEDLQTTGTAVTDEEPAAEDDKAPLPANLYELLIKKEDKAPDEAPKSPWGKFKGWIRRTFSPPPSGYQPGDIVMIKPAGHLWGSSERNNFTIIQAYLTPEEVEELMSPKTARDGTVTGRRRHRIDIGKKDIKEKVKGMRGAIRGKPLLERADIEAKK